MTPTIATDVVATANAVRGAVSAAYEGLACEAAANSAVSSASPVVAVAEGMSALWARAASLDVAGIDALASAAHHVAQGALWGRGGLAADILVALAIAPSAAAITGGPPLDPRFVVAEQSPP
ncbi:MAG: hypothetical protein ACRDD1_06720 [Planctomycetia bacterium]